MEESLTVCENGSTYGRMKNVHVVHCTDCGDSDQALNHVIMLISENKTASSIRIILQATVHVAVYQ